MLVAGGRTRWVRVVSRWSAWGVALLVVASGCGGRTSTLDQEAYLEQDPATSAGALNGGGSPNQAGSATFGGSPSLPVGGTSSMPSPTAGQSSGPSDAVRTTCKNYCSGYATKCPAELGGQNCQLACEQEMTAIAKCTSSGLKALKCLTPFFQDPGVSCGAAIGSALNKCNTQVKRFQKCKGTPTPQPEPQPRPEPDPVPTSCPGVGEAGPNYCRDLYSCADGTYSVSCEWAGAGPGTASTYNCTCMTPSSGQAFAVTAAVPPCVAATQVCGFTNAILK